MTKQQIFEEAQRLSRGEQLDLADELWELGHRGSDISPELKAELDRQVTEDNADTSPAEPVEVVIQRILRGSVRGDQACRSA